MIEETLLGSGYLVDLEKTFLYIKLKIENYLKTSGFATTYVVVSVRHPITYFPCPTSYQHKLKVHTGENKIDR